MKTASAGSRQNGSTLIALLIAALIVAILWTARFKKSEQEKADPSGHPGIGTVEDMNKVIDQTRKVQKEQEQQAKDMQRRMIQVDQ